MVTFPLTFQWVAFQDVRLPPSRLSQKLSLDHFAMSKSVAGTGGKTALSREAALLLAQLHPMVVIQTGRAFECVAGIRTLLLISPLLRIDDQVPVAIVPQSTPREILVETMQADALVTSMAFALDKPAAAMFSMSRRLDPELISRLSPALADTVETCADLLGVSPPTLYKLQRRKK